jgi:hypothetical protein
MTEIKYQIWHKPTKTIQVVALIDFSRKTLFTYDEPMDEIPFKDVEWRQFTGLYDKNKQEIYYGDIYVDEDYGWKDFVTDLVVSNWLIEKDKMNNPLSTIKIIGHIYE